MSVNVDIQSRPKVLVCDDDASVRMLTRRCLEADDMIVVEAASGVEALELFITERPDLLFLDVEMPGMDGLEVCRRIRKMSQGEVIPIMIVTGSDDRKSIDDGFQAGATQYKTKPVNWSLLSRDVQYMLRASNAFHSLKRQEDRLRYLAYFDPLTNLPNRRSFIEQLNRILKRTKRRDASAALLFIDLDNFKRINDSIGHGRGDKLLVEISKRLTMELREDDAISYLEPDEDTEHDGSTEIARLGGDEFTVVLSDIADITSVEVVARRILERLSKPIALQSHNPVVTPSIGIAIYPDDGADPEDLVRNADTAMYAAKAEGRACYRFYNERMNSKAVEHLKLEEDLRDGIVGNQLELHYQPQVDTNSGAVVSMEALVRWNHPERGRISPVDFIPVAERTGLIVELGDWVLQEAARNCAAWEKAGFNNFRICVNLSPVQFSQPDLADSVATFLQESGLAAHRLELELTESAIMTDAETNIEKLRQLKNLGVALAVDDFGTGYSSLSYLKRFPIDTLKIDQSFISDLGSQDGQALVDAIIAVATTLQMKVIAEGVETLDQVNYLMQHNCHLLQGYYFSRPVPVPEVQDLLEKDYSSTFEPAAND